MTTQQKQEALQNALSSFGIKKDFCIKTDEIKGKTFALAVLKTSAPPGAPSWHEYSYEEPITPFMSYECLNEYLRGCYDTHVNKYKLF